MYIPEHCGHGRSYRLVEEPSLVHVDSYKRYVADLLFVARTAKKEHKNLKLYLFGHSMGGGIAAAAVAAKPKLFERLVLSSPTDKFVYNNKEILKADIEVAHFGADKDGLQL